MAPIPANGCTTCDPWPRPLLPVVPRQSLGVLPYTAAGACTPARDSSTRPPARLSSPRVVAVWNCTTSRSPAGVRESELRAVGIVREESIGKHAQLCKQVLSRGVGENAFEHRGFLQRAKSSCARFNFGLQVGLDKRFCAEWCPEEDQSALTGRV